MGRSAKLYQAGHHYVLKIPGTGKFWLRAGIGFFVICLAGLFFIGEKNVFKLNELYREQRQLKIRVAELRAGNQKLTQQIEDLKTDPQAVERIAREELGMVQKEEIVYRFVPAAKPRE